MGKLIFCIIIFIQFVFFLWFLKLFVESIFSESGVPKYKNPPLPPKKRKCVGIVMGRILYRNDHS